MGMMELLQQGGWLMAPIGALSVVAGAIFLERLWKFQKTKLVPDGFLRALIALLSDRQNAQAIQLTHQNDSVLARIMRESLPHRHLTRTELKERMGEYGENELAALERRLGALSTIATISPLMGLLGTITGMIRVFRQISAELDPAVSSLAGGIWEALLTTAAGLVVAIPAYVGHQYLIGLLEIRSQELTEACQHVLNVVQETGADAS